MSAVYFMGAKEGHKKSDGAWFGNCLLLFQNQYGQWTCGGKDCGWFEDEQIFHSCIDGLAVGQSVTVFRDMGGRIVQLAENPEYPDLLLE